MGKMKKEGKKSGFMPPFPMFPAPDPSEWGWGWSSSDRKSNWEKRIDFQKSSFDSAKDQYTQFFDYMAGMLDTFAESLPEEMPWMPMWAKPPKSVRKEMKEWEKMANEHFVELASSWTDFVIKSQEKVCEQIPNATENIEETDAVTEAETK